MRRCVAHKSKVPRPKAKVTIRSEVKLCLKLCCYLTTDEILMKLHRQIKQNEKVCRPQDLGSHAQGQGHRLEVKIMSKQNLKNY